MSSSSPARSLARNFSRVADDLGVAFQLANFIRDVGEDLDRGRIYLPLEDLERFDLTEAQAGRNIITVQENHISLPPGAKINKIDPASVEIMIDILGRKELPLQVDWHGRLPEGILVQDVRVNPETIEVTGGQLLLDRLAAVYTEKVVVDNLQASGSIQVAIALHPASIKLSALQSDQVRISYKIVPRR